MEEKEMITEQEVVAQEAEKIVEAIPEEKLEEFAEKIKEISKPKPIMGSLQALKNLFSMAIPSSRGSATAPHNPAHKGGVGITRKNKDQSKDAQKRAKKSRKLNAQRKNKKFRPAGSKQRK